MRLQRLTIDGCVIEPDGEARHLTIASAQTNNFYAFSNANVAFRKKVARSNLLSVIQHFLAGDVLGKRLCLGRKLNGLFHFPKCPRYAVAPVLLFVIPQADLQARLIFHRFDNRLDGGFGVGDGRFIDLRDIVFRVIVSTNVPGQRCKFMPA